MTPSKGRVQKRESGLPDMAVPAKETERWYPPDPEHTTTYQVNVDMPDLGRIIGRTEFDEAGRMTEFALTAQVELAGEWWDVIRVDTCHGEVHAHFMYRTREYEDREIIRPIYSQNDVHRGYGEAETLLVTCWSENVTRWRGGF